MTRGRLSALLVVLAIVLAGCSARRIREAQDEFNRAAAVERQLEDARSPAADGLRASAGAASGYAAALRLLDEELAAHRSDLAAEELLGTALVLKALCLWRIEALADGAEFERPDGRSDALAAALAEAQAPGVVLGTRDRVLVAALPGLRDHDRALRARDYATAKRFFRSANGVLASSLEEIRPPPNHPVHVYVRLAQMRTLRAWLAANYAMNAKNVEETRAIHAAFHAIADALAAQIETTPALRAEVQELAKALGTSWPRP